MKKITPLIVLVFIISRLFVSNTLGQIVANNTDTDILFYHLKIEVAIDSEYIKGEVLCKFKARKDINDITLDLAKGLKVTKVEGAQTFKHQDAALIVSLKKPLHKDETGSIKIFYQGRPPKATDGLVTKGLIYEKHGDKKDEPVIVSLSTPYLAHLWYPCKDGVSDKADSIYVDITVKDTLINGTPLMGVSSGILQDSSFSGGKRTYMWRHRYPITPFYLLLAVSNYKRLTQGYEDPFGNSYPLECFVFPEKEQESMALFRKLPDIMNVLSNTFGPYPFLKEKFGLTQMGFYSGIETQTNAIVTNLKGTNIPLAVHEAAHQWFGNNLTCDSWADGWIHEAVANYAEVLWAEYRRGSEDAQKNLKSLAWFDEGTLHLPDTDNPFRVFKPIIYNKGTCMMHSLRYAMTEKYFFEMLQKLPADPRYRYKNISAEEFQTYCEKISAEDLEYFFKQWVYGEYYPIYDLEYGTNEDGSKLKITVNQQKLETSPNYFIMPLEFKILFEDGTSQLESVFNDIAGQSYEININGKPVKGIVFDPEMHVPIKKLRFTRRILNTKQPFQITKIAEDAIGRKITLNFDSKKSQDVNIELLNDKNESVWSLKLTKLSGIGNSPFTIPESVANGVYNVRVSSKSDTYVWMQKVN